MGKRRHSYFNQRQRKRTPPIVYSTVLISAQGGNSDYVPLSTEEERNGRPVLKIEISNKDNTGKLTELALFDTGSDISFYREEFLDPKEVLGIKPKSTELRLKGISGYDTWRTKSFKARVRFGDYIFMLRFYALDEDRFPSTSISDGKLTKFLVGQDFRQKAGIVHMQQAKKLSHSIPTASPAKTHTHEKITEGN